MEGSHEIGVRKIWKKSQNLEGIWFGIAPNAALWDCQMRTARENRR
jgi:hypothetical protein